MFWTYRCLLLVVTALLVGCAASAVTAPSPGEPPITTDRTSYLLTAGSLGWEGEIAFEYTNPSDRTISILNCRESFSLRLERWDGSEWVTAWSPPIPLCLSAPIEIRPGAVYERTLPVFGGYPNGRTHPRFEVERIDGTYRLVIDSAFWNYDHQGPPWGEQLPLEQRVSNTFELRTPSR